MKSLKFMTVMVKNNISNVHKLKLFHLSGHIWANFFKHSKTLFRVYLQNVVQHSFRQMSMQPMYIHTLFIHR
jgi:hypothetical protein